MHMPNTDAYSGGEDPAQNMEELLSVGEAATLIGYSVSTLQRWDRAGILKARRSPTNQRRYRRGDVLAVLDAEPAGDTAA